MNNLNNSVFMHLSIKLCTVRMAFRRSYHVVSLTLNTVN